MIIHIIFAVLGYLLLNFLFTHTYKLVKRWSREDNVVYYRHDDQTYLKLDYKMYHKLLIILGCAVIPVMPFIVGLIVWIIFIADSDYLINLNIKKGSKLDKFVNYLNKKA